MVNETEMYKSCGWGNVSYWQFLITNFYEDATLKIQILINKVTQGHYHYQSFNQSECRGWRTVKFDDIYSL